MSDDSVVYTIPRFNLQPSEVNEVPLQICRLQWGVDFGSDS